MSKDIPAPLPAGARKWQDLSKYEELSLEELDRVMLTGKDPTKEEEEEEEQSDDLMDPAPKDNEEPEPEPEKDEPEEEEQEEEEEEEPKEEPEPKKEEDPLANKIRLLERRLELEALERVKETEARKRAELLASKQAGRAGYLQQQLKKAPAKAQPDDAEEEADGDEKEERQEQNRPEPEVSQEWMEDRAELVKMAINDEGNEFSRQHAEELEEMPAEFINRLRELVREEAAPFAEEFKTSSMKTVRKLARSLMNSAYATCRIEFADKVAENAKAEATARKAESAGKSQRRKAKAAISKGGHKGKPAPVNKSYEDMSLDELEAEMKKEFGENYRPGHDKSRHGGL